jgi:hypothetical protein
MRTAIAYPPAFRETRNLENMRNRYSAKGAIKQGLIGNARSFNPRRHVDLLHYSYDTLERSSHYGMLPNIDLFDGSIEGIFTPECPEPTDSAAAASPSIRRGDSIGGAHAGFLPAGCPIQ